MSIEHDNLPVNPRLDTLLRQLVAANDLQPEQNQRIRAQLGLHSHHLTGQPTASLPTSRRGPLPIPPVEQEGIPMIATTSGRLRQQWLQFALAAVAFIAAGVVLAMIFGSGSDDPETRPGTASSPTAGLLDDALTVEEAQERLSFDLIIPDTWPASLSIAGVFVNDDNRMANIWLTDGGVVPAFTINQTTESVTTPDAEDMQQVLLDSLDQPPATELPDPTQTTVVIAGRTILQTIIYGADARPIYLYSWNQGDIHIDVDSFTRTQSEVEQIVEAIASLPDQPGASDAVVFLQWLAEHERFARQPTPTASPQPGEVPRGPAEVSGELVIEDACLRLEQTSTGEGILLIWPPEYAFENTPAGGRIRDGSGTIVATVGDTVSIEGGFLAAGTDLPGFLNDPQASACAEPSHILVGRVTTTAAPATATTGGQEPSALPTPDDMGSYRGITLEQAQEIVPFEIVMPERVPNGLEPPTITVMDLGPLTTGGRRYHVQVYFEVSGSDSPRKSVLFIQTSPASNAPNMPEAETTTTTIGGVEVNRTTGVNAGGEPLLAYWWTNNDIGYQIMSNPEGVLTPELVEDVMLAILPVTTVDDQEPSALPTPDDTGTYNGITLEQAQAIVPFEITMPMQIPDELEPPGITVVESPPLAVGGRVYRVEMYFELSGDESPRKSVQFTQISSPGSGNPPEGETTTFGTPIGIDVNRTTSTNVAGDPLLIYWWERDDIDYQILAAPEGDLTPGLVEDLMLAILVPPGPTAEEQSAILEQERAEMMPFPIPDTCAVTGWAGPDFRIGQQYASAYFIDDNGLTLGTTHGVLFTGENEITWFAAAPLTTAEALSGPTTIRAMKLDGDGAMVELPIEVIEQISQLGRDDDVERAWWSTVNFPSEGCWEVNVSLGAHVLDATVYVYARQ